MDPQVIETIEKALQEEECEEIILDDLTIGTLTADFVEKLKRVENLQDLSLNKCGITSLKGFPAELPIVRLELNDNDFDGVELKYLQDLPELQTLSLMNNKITEYSQLEPLKKLTKLVQLDLSECPISNKPDYRKKIFEMFSALEILDNKDAEGNSYDYEDGEGEFEGEGDYEDGDLEGEEEFGDDLDEEDYQEEDDDDESEEKGKPAKKLKK